MAIGNVWVLHGLSTPAQFYGNVRDITPAAGVDIMQNFSAGFPQPLFTGVRGVAPEVVVESHQVGTLITEFGLFGANLTAGNVDLYYKAVASQGVRQADASLVHTRMRMANAYGYLQQISAGHQQEATARLRLVSPFDGTNAPIVPAGSLALVGTPVANEFYGLGPISINAANLAGVRDVTIEFGAEVMELGDASELYHSFVAVKSITPVITIRVLEQAWVTYGLAGTALTALVLYLRRKTVDGGNVADITASHVKIEATAGLITVDNTSGGGNDEAVTTVRLTLRAPSAAANALTLTPSVAIT